MKGINARLYRLLLMNRDSLPVSARKPVRLPEALTTLLVKDVAVELQMSTRSVIRLLKANRIRGYQTFPRGEWRTTLSAVEEFIHMEMGESRQVNQSIVLKKVA